MNSAAQSIEMHKTSTNQRVHLIKMNGRNIRYESSTYARSAGAFETNYHSHSVTTQSFALNFHV